MWPNLIWPTWSVADMVYTHVSPHDQRYENLVKTNRERGSTAGYACANICESYAESLHKFLAFSLNFLPFYRIQLFTKTRWSRTIVVESLAQRYFWRYANGAILYEKDPLRKSCLYFISFWKVFLYGTSPYRFQIRSSVRSQYDAEIQGWKLDGMRRYGIPARVWVITGSDRICLDRSWKCAGSKLEMHRIGPDLSWKCTGSDMIYER